MNHLYRRLGAFELAVAAVAVGVGVGGVGVAAADPTPEPVRPPNCAAADLAGIAAGVAAATSAYLYTHPTSTASSLVCTACRTRKPPTRSATSSTPTRRSTPN